MAKVKIKKRGEKAIDRVEALFRRRWGHASMRPEQRTAIEHLLAGRDVLTVLPTGYGKSMVFQAPAGVLRGTVLVVSPLIALMDDQVRGCKERGVKAAALHSGHAADQQRQKLSRFVAGSLDLLYVSPERLRSSGFRRALDKAEVPLVAIDEAHSLVADGQDFRPAYMLIAEMLASLNPRPPVAALTATATRHTGEVIREALDFADEAGDVRADPTRPNLSYQATDATDTNAWEVLKAIAPVIDPNNGRHLVYTTTRKGAEQAAKILRGTVKVAVSHYHGGMLPKDRERTHTAFAEGTVPVVCATKAFGMGIDLPDIRTIIHLGIPDTVEAYTQETGRAGRDGAPSQVYLIHDKFSYQLQERFNREKNPPYTAYQHVWEQLHRDVPEGEGVVISPKAFSTAIKKDQGAQVGADQVEAVLLRMEAHRLISRGYRAAGTVYQVQVPRIRRLQGYTTGPTTAAMRAIANAAGHQGEAMLDASALARNAGVTYTVAEAAIERAIRDGALAESRRISSKSVTLDKRGAQLRHALPEADVDEKRQRDAQRLQAMAGYVRAADKPAYIRDYFERF